MLFTSFIFITLLHDAVRKFGTFLLRHPAMTFWAGLASRQHSFVFKSLQSFAMKERRYS